MTLEYKGKEIGFSFGLYFLGKAQGFLGVSDFNELIQSLKTRADIVDMMYISAKTYAKRKEQYFNVTLDEWVTSFESDEISVDKITEWESLFVEKINDVFGLSKEEEDDVEELKKK